MDDVIKLISVSYTTDESGNQIEQKTERQVFCKVNSANRTEFYQAAQAGHHPNYVFSLSHYKDYHNEPLLSYTDWSGTEREYTITRTYIRNNGIDLTAEERVANYQGE